MGTWRDSLSVYQPCTRERNPSSCARPAPEDFPHCRETNRKSSFFGARLSKMGEMLRMRGGVERFAGQ